VFSMEGQGPRKNMEEHGELVALIEAGLESVRAMNELLASDLS
jgi:hypothetical protein